MCCTLSLIYMQITTHFHIKRFEIELEGKSKMACYMKLTRNAGKKGRVSHEWFLFCFQSSFQASFVKQKSKKSIKPTKKDTDSEWVMINFGFW